MMKRFFQLLFILQFTFPQLRAVNLELYPNFHTIGISVRSASAFPAGSTGVVYYAEKQGAGWGAFKKGFELTRVTDNYYAGCIFYTLPEKMYKVHVQIVFNKSIQADITDSVVCRTYPHSANPKRIFYVSPTGSGISGNASAPGALSQALLNQLQAGDKVILKPGIYYTGELDIKSSGTGSDPIVFEGEDMNVYIDGSIPGNISWERVNTTPHHRDSNMFRANLGPLNSNCVVVNGKRMYPYRNIAELSNFSSIRAIDGSGNYTGVFSIGKDGFFRDGRSSTANLAPYTNFNPYVYIKFADGSDTAGKEIRVSEKGWAFRIKNYQFIQFRNINFQYFGAAAQHNIRSAFLAENANELFFDSCNFEFCDHGISFTGSSSHNTIESCAFLDDLAGLSYFQFKETGLDYQHLNFYYPNFFPFQARNVEPGRVYFDHQFTGRGNVITGSYFSGGCDGITCPDTPGDSTTARHFDICYNTFGPGSDDAFEVDGNASNIRVWGNTMHGAANGISVASPCYGPVYIFRNVMYDFRKTIYQYVVNVTTLLTDTIPASPLKLNAAYCDLPGTVYFMHNTISAGKESYGFVTYQPQSRSSWRKVVARNNIFFNDNQNITLWVRAASDSVDLDYNQYYSSGGFRARQDRPNYAEYTQLPVVNNNILGNINNANSGIEKHGLVADPRNGWVNYQNQDFRLKASAPAVDAGEIIAGINDYFNGIAPDCGAYEFSGTGSANQRVQSLFVQVFPNPFNEKVYLHVSGNDEKLHIQITDLGGKILSESFYSGNENIILETSQWQSGIYFLKIQCGNKTAVSKLIKISN